MRQYIYIVLFLVPGCNGSNPKDFSEKHKQESILPKVVNDEDSSVQGGKSEPMSIEEFQKQFNCSDCLGYGYLGEREERKYIIDTQKNIYHWWENCEEIPENYFKTPGWRRSVKKPDATPCPKCVQRDKEIDM